MSRRSDLSDQVHDFGRRASIPHANPQNQEKAAIILAGGQSLRFGSDKALQTLSGRQLIRHVVERVLAVTREVVVVVGRGDPKAEYYKALPTSVRVVNDDLEGKNPMIGIVSGLAATESDYAAILACDVPFVNSGVIELLFRRASNADAAIPRWNRQRRIEPLQAVYRRIPTLKAALGTLTSADLSLEDMIKKLDRVVYVSVEDEIANIDHGLSTFFNINTREDMKVAESMVAEKRFERPSLNGTE